MRVCRYLFVFLGLLCLLAQAATAEAQSLVHSWSDSYGNAPYQWATGIATDGDGNILATGYFEGTVNFGGSDLTQIWGVDIYVVKFDPTGNHIWSKQFGDDVDQLSYDITTDRSGNVFVSGDFEGTVNFGGIGLTSTGGYDIFIAKFDAAGNHMWSKSFGDASSQSARGLATDGSGNVIMVGHYSGSMDFGGGVLTSAGGDIFVAKFDAAGNHVWSKRFGDGNSQTAYGVTVDGWGNVVLTGGNGGTVNFGGGALITAGSSDIYVAKFDAAGNHIWSNGYGDASAQYGVSVTADGSGNVSVAGRFQGTVNFGGGVLTGAGDYDIFVAQFDASGNHNWSKSFGDSDTQYASELVADGAGDVKLLGYFVGTVDFGGGPLTAISSWSIYVAQFDAAGNHIWSDNYGTSFCYPGGIAVDGLGNTVVAAYFGGDVDFGGGTLSSTGSYDIAIAKLWQAVPRFAGARDVPGDQGGWVNLSWEASGMDNTVDHEITHYTTWRAIDPSQLSSMMARGASVVTDVAAGAWSKAETGKPLIRLQRVAGASYYWYLIGTVDAYYLPGYSAPMPTLFDSTAVSNENHYFQVIAHTGNPYVFYTSVPDSGYSVDNLAPAAPLSLAGEQNYTPEGLSLSWRQNHEADLACYSIYRGASALFDPGPGNWIASPKDTTSFDDLWRWDSGYYYKVSAVDLHGNQSGYALLGPEGVTGAGSPGVPDAFALGQNVPNPFNPTTTIHYDVPADGGAVMLQIFDVSGRLVRTLVDGHQSMGSQTAIWNGADDRGNGVSSGVYFYRMEAPGFASTRKMVLLR